MFAVHIPVDRAGYTQDIFEELVFEVASWLRGRFALEVSNSPEGEAASDTATVRWSTLTGAVGQLRTFRVEHPDTNGEPWSWRTDAWVGEEGDSHWLRVRVAIRPTRDDQIIDPTVAVGTPRFVHSIVTRYGTRVDGLSLESWSRVEPNGVGGYVEFLENADRALPVVAVTRSPNGPPPPDPAALASRLRGVAHVVAVSPEATYHISDEITPKLSCFGGAVRLYWPGFTRQANPLSHQLWVPRNMMSAEAIADEVVARVGRAAALVYGAPRLEMALRREASAAAIASARAERETHARERELLRSSKGGLSAAEFEAFSSEFASLEVRAADYEHRIENLEFELELARDERERAKDAERQAWAVVTESQRAVASSLTETPGASEPLTVRQAVDQAASRCDHLTFLQSAFESADESQYGDPPQVLADLLVLDEVAKMWVEGSMNTDFRTVFKDRHTGFRGDISQTAATKYADDYTIRYGGRTELMGPHLRRGVGPPPTILGIYWFKDDDAKRLVVGHVGRKLRDDSNRN